MKKQHPTPRRIKVRSKTYAAKAISKGYKQLLAPYHMKVKK